MQAAANQVRWVPIGEIVEPWEESAEGEPDGAVVLSQRPDGRYTLVSGLNTLRRMRVRSVWMRLPAPRNVWKGAWRGFWIS